MESSINSELVANTLNFHGQQFQKIWESERGEVELGKIRDLNFDVYMKRNKHLSFQDRAKRLKLQQFIAKKADTLFAKEALVRSEIPEETIVTEDTFAVMPSLETYMNVDKQARLKYFRENVKIGDLILGTIISKTQSGMMLKVLCTTGHGVSVHYVADINVKAFCPVANIIPAVDRKGVSRSYMMNDSVCCEVLEVIADTDKIMCGMKGTTRQPTDPEHRPPLGLISADDFPLAYKKALDHKNETYETVLEKSVGFNNPNNISHLSTHLGIDMHCSNMKGLRGSFPENEYASELRQQQASKWAYSNVADGIDHFKAGRHTEAFQCLNKALHIDPKNVEGLVARGALYANSGNFQKAIEDFETALKLNPNHANARKYMGETLVALGRSYEEENKFDEAKKAYQSCLLIIPFHEEAQNSLDFLKTKNQPTKHLIEPTELLLPNLITKPTQDDVLKHLLNKTEEEDKKEKKKKKKSKKRKSRRRSSSSSSSSSSGSNDSSSSSSSSSTDSSSSSGDSDFKKRKKNRSRSRREKPSSLSPLSKRMAMMDPTHDTPTNYQFNKPASTLPTNLEFSLDRPKSETSESYEVKLKAFLEQTKGDADYEDKVRKFLEESAKWKKDKKDDKKKKKKKDKKSKKDSKKKRKDKKLKRKLDEYELRDALKKELGIKDSKRSSKKQPPQGLNSDDEEYLLQKVGYSKRFLESLPDLDELESKLNAYYALEKEAKRSGSDMSESPKRSNSPSPTREQKARQAVAEATASVSASGGNSQSAKWKMQIGAGAPSTSRFKRKPDHREEISSWHDGLMHDKNGADIMMMHEQQASGSKKMPPLPPLPTEKNMSIRKSMSMKEAMPSRKLPEIEMPKKKPVPASKPVPAGQVVLDKFGNFRLVSPPKDPRHEDMPPLPPGAPPKSYQGGRSKPPEPPGRPRSDSRSPRRSRSHSRGKYSRSRSSSGSRSRSRSYNRSRSRSYYSRSRSRSGSFYSRSRSRSRSYSGDRRRNRRGGFRGRFNDRGTYYKPRFQNPRNYNNRGGRGGGGGQFFNNRDRFNDRDFRGGRGRPFFNRGRRPRGRFQRGGFRDFGRDRRYDRSRSRDRSRSYSGSRERDSSPADREPMKKVNEEKEKINKYIDTEGGAPVGGGGDASTAPIRHEGPLSEGEDRDDYTNDKYVDRDSYAGKWAEKDGGGAGGGGGDGNHAGGGGDSIPPETNIEEMDKFLSKVKKDKKEEMLERNKDIIKPKA